VCNRLLQVQLSIMRAVAVAVEELHLVGWAAAVVAGTVA
jgi:hypothetical protein